MTIPTVRPGAWLALVLLSACSGGSQTSTQAEPQGFFAEVAIGAGGALPTEDVPVDPRGAVLRRVDDGFTVTVTDPAALGNHLPPGSVIAVRGELRAGVAHLTEIVHRAAIRGSLAGRGESSLAVAGVEAVFGPDTPVLDAAGAPVEPVALAGGAFLEVNGWSSGGALLRATGIRVLPGAPMLRLRGYARTAPVGGVFPLALLSGEPEVVLVDARAFTLEVPAAARVRVDGSEITAGMLTATAVAVETELLPFPGDRVVIEGVVTRRGDGELGVGPHQVLLGDGIAYRDVPAGGTAEEALAPGAHLRVQGTATGPDRVVTAEAVRLMGVQRLAGRIHDFHVGEPATSGSLQIGGMTVGLGPYTSIVDASENKLTIRELVDRHAAHAEGLPIVVHGHAERPDPELGEAVRAYRVRVDEQE